MILIHHESGRDRKMLLAIQLSKGAKKGEVTFLATLKTKDMKEGDSQEEVIQVLEAFQDVMPLKLPKKLSPRREVYHWIKLVLNAHPPAMAIYRMTSLELEEL